jgi:hypothetical protein
MYDESMRDEALELRIERALERAPQAEIPADFASRVAAQVPARPQTVRETRYGRRTMIGGLVVLFVAILAFAPRAGTSQIVSVTIEWTLCAQFVLLALWLGTKRVLR